MKVTKINPLHVKAFLIKKNIYFPKQEILKIIALFYIFINLSGNVSGFLQNMPNIYGRFKSFSASLERIETKLCAPEVRDGIIASK